MENKISKFFTIITIIITFLPLTASAHPGRTDAYGCHTCRTNCVKWGLSSGEYHCHNAKVLPQPLAPVTSRKSTTDAPGVTVPAPHYAKPIVKPASKAVTAPAPKPNVVTSTPKIQPKVSVQVRESWFKKLLRSFSR